MLPSMNNKKILISEQKIKSFINPQQLLTSQQNIKQVLLKDTYISISKYSDSLMIVINQTGTMGSIYKAKLTGESLPQVQQQYQNQMDSIQYKNQFNITQLQKIYQIKCLFGSTQIEFYQLLIRKLLQFIYEERKIDPTNFVVINLSLPLKCKEWEKYQIDYYQQIVKEISRMLNQV